MDLDLDRRDFRVIAEGDDGIDHELTIVEALAVLEFAREHGKRHVAIVDDTTGVVVDEGEARQWVETSAAEAVTREAPSVDLADTSRNEAVVPCPACQDERGAPVGDVLTQLPSGTWVRDQCSVCRGLKVLDAEGQARYQMRVAGE